MSDEKDRGTGGLIPSAAGGIVVMSTSLVRRGLNFLEAQKPTEDATVTQLREAAEQGNADGQCGLGYAYRDGRGVPQDYVEAHKWMNLAASHDSGDLQKNRAAARDDLAKLMTPAQVADAQSRAREWIEAFQRRKQ